MFIRSAARYYSRLLPSNPVTAMSKNTMTSIKPEDRGISGTGLAEALLSTLEEGAMVVCIKDCNKFVLKQNQRCIDLCGNLEGQTCLDGCMEIYERDTLQQWHEWGSRTYKNCFLHDAYYDTTLICSDKHIITLLQPLEERQQQAKEHYKKMGLSRRETGVIELAIAGLSNAFICEKLSISNSTLRTHLNNIYKKSHDSGISLTHIPKERKKGKS